MFFGKNILDIIIVTFLVFCTIFSFFKGVIRELFSILALTVGIFFARQYYHQIAIKWGLWLAPQLSKIAAFLVLFLAAYLLIILAGKILRKTAYSIELSWLDHLGGAFLGLVKGGVIACLLVLVLMFILPGNSQLIQTSHLTRYIFYVSDLLIKVTPGEMRRNLGEKLKKLENYFDKEAPGRQKSGVD